MNYLIYSLLLTACIDVGHSTTHLFCRDRLGYFLTDDFKISSCSMCYFYLVTGERAYSLDHSILETTLHPNPYVLISKDNNTGAIKTVFPDIDNQASIDDVCATIDDVMCNRWITCCEDAWKCCQRQLQMTSPDDDGVYCPQTFDGWSCWNYTLANVTAFQTCPTFLTSRKDNTDVYSSSKTCMSDGSWQTESGSGLEYTVYDNCSGTSDVQIYRTSLILGIILNGIGMALLLPSIAVFLIYKSLWRQCRIKIHINLFMAVLLTSVLSLVWDVAIRLDRLTHDESHSHLYNNQIMCKSVHVLQLFARSTSFYWMTCEGFFLHRLMVNAFSPPRQFYGYVLYGWGVPTVMFCLYGGLRKLLADDSTCWILPLDGDKIWLLWALVYIPTIVCILVNIIFLVRLLRRLLTKMVSHPNEPSSFRKALKATFILVPVFGIHQFCLIYRPSSPEATGYDVYEIVSAIVLNSQGIIISLVFSVFNGEIQSHIKGSFKKISRRYSNQRGLTDRKSSVSRRTSVSSLQNGANKSDISLNTMASVCSEEMCNIERVNKDTKL